MNFQPFSPELIADCFAGAFIIAFAAYKLRMLSLSGMIAATCIGGIIFGFGGISASVLLMFFFLSGSLLGRLNTPPPFQGGGWGVVSRDGNNHPLILSLKRRGDARDFKQVLCNGIVPAIAVMIIYFRHDLREEISLLFLGALATATADTWATEIGMRFGKSTYNVFTFRKMKKGLSGGVSFAGLFASILGAFFIGALSLIRFNETDALCGLVLIKVIPVIMISGFIGALLDSIIGATIQAKYKLPEGGITEVKSEGAVLVSGSRFIGNNVTNLIATFWGGLVAIWLGAVL
jgi:uncharacterized protein (TIGR00297 family)